MPAARCRKLKALAPAPEPPAPGPLLHEAQPVEVGSDAEGRALRVLRGRVRAEVPGLSPYLFCILRFSEVEAGLPVAAGYERVSVWLTPTDDGSCRYTLTDRAKASGPKCA
jgi:hypothetical protein